MEPVPGWARSIAVVVAIGTVLVGIPTLALSVRLIARHRSCRQPQHVERPHQVDHHRTRKAFESMRPTAPHHTLASDFSRTRPITTAVSAIQY